MGVEHRVPHFDGAGGCGCSCSACQIGSECFCPGCSCPASDRRPRSLDTPALYAAEGWYAKTFRGPDLVEPGPDGTVILATTDGSGTTTRFPVRTAERDCA